MFKRDEEVSEYLVPFFHIDDFLHPLQLRLVFRYFESRLLQHPGRTSRLTRASGNAEKL